MHSDSRDSLIRPTTEFSLDTASPTSPHMLRFKGRPVVAVQGSVVEAQFRLPDGSALVLVSDHTPFEEVLTLSLIGPDLRERDRALVGGAYPQGFLAYAAGRGTNQVEFCWHDLDLVATVARHWSWLSLRRRWLSLEDTIPQRDPARRRAGRNPLAPSFGATLWAKLRIVRQPEGRKTQ